MRRTPWWALVSSGAAPVALIGGWTVAARLQPEPFDATRETISALAASGAAHRGVMTAALLAVGACHVVTAAGLRVAALPGRLVLGAGGLATLAIGLLPLPDGDGGSTPHAVAAGVAFAALAAWPALAVRRAAGAPAALRRPAAVGASVALGSLVAWFAAELVAGSDRVGLAERVVAGAQALWPLVVVVSARR